MAGRELESFVTLDYRGHCSYTYFFLLVYFSPSLFSSLSNVDTHTDTDTTVMRIRIWMNVFTHAGDGKGFRFLI